MNSLMLISKVGGYEAARRILDQLEFELKPMGFADFTVTLDNGFSFKASALYKAYFEPKFDYWDGIVIGKLGKSSKVIISNKHGYIGSYWGYQSFRPVELESVWGLERLKSDIINYGGKVDWDTYQWVLNNFSMIKESCQ